MNLRGPSKPVQYLITAAAVAPAVYWMLNYSGPYAWLMELERARFGWTSSRLTAIAVVGLLYLPLWLITSAGGVERVVDPEAPEATPAPQRETKQRSALIAGGAAAFLLAVAGWWFWASAAAGELRKVTAADFAAGRVAAPAFVELEGKALPQTVRVTTAGGDATLFIPVAGASLVVEANAKEAGALLAGERVRATGIARTGILEGEVRATLRESGVVLGDTTWVVQTGNRPDAGRFGALVFAGVAIAIGGFLYGLRRRVLG